MKSSKKKAEELKRDTLTQIAYFRSQAAKKETAQKAEINMFRQKCNNCNAKDMDDTFSFITESDIYLKGSDEIINKLNMIMGNADLLSKKGTLPPDVQIALEYVDAVYEIMKGRGINVNYQKTIKSLMKTHHGNKGALCPHEVLVFFGMEKCTDEDAINTFNQLKLNYGIQDNDFLRSALTQYGCVFTSPLTQNTTQTLQNTMPQPGIDPVLAQQFGFSPGIPMPVYPQPFPVIPPQNLYSSQNVPQQTNMTQHVPQTFAPDIPPQNIPGMPQFQEMPTVPSYSVMPQVPTQPQAPNLETTPPGIPPQIPDSQIQSSTTTTNIPPTFQLGATNILPPTPPLNGAELIQQTLNAAQPGMVPPYAPPPSSFDQLPTIPDSTDETRGPAPYY